MNYKELEDGCKICVCIGTTLGELKEAIKDGAMTVTELIEETNAGTRCRLCKFEELDVAGRRPYYLDKVIESENN